MGKKLKILMFLREIFQIQIRTKNGPDLTQTRSKFFDQNPSLKMSGFRECRIEVAMGKLLFLLQ